MKKLISTILLFTLIPLFLHASDTIEDISSPWYNAEAPMSDVYIDSLEAFPSKYIDKNSRIQCTKLSVKENSSDENIYNISGVCQLERDKDKGRKINPFGIQFVSVMRIAELIMSHKKEDIAFLDGVLIKDETNLTFAKYIYVVNSVTLKN